MTTLQLRVILITAELGSITAAAKELGISQPNASNSIHTLEEEIGFPVFYRAKGGTQLTEKGLQFIKHARNILAENDSIMGIGKQDSIYRLRLGTCNYYDAIEPFIKICEAHRNDPVADFSYYSISLHEGLKMLTNYDLDIVFTAIMKSQITAVTNICKKNNLTAIHVADFQAVINLRKNHPALLDGSCYNLTQGSAAMKDYPYIAYRNFSDNSVDTAYHDADFIQCSYKMYVDEADVRRRLVATTNGFSFGITSSKILRKRYDTVSVPIPDVKAELICLIRTPDTDRYEINEYIDLLRKEIETV